MSTANLKRRRKKQDPGPELPMKPGKAPKPAWKPAVFRRSQRSYRLYARLKDAEGKIIVRSTGAKTTAGAHDWLTIKLHQIETQKAALATTAPVV